MICSGITVVTAVVISFGTRTI